MKQTYLFILILFLARGSTLAQCDTLIIETGSIIKKYPPSDIAQITFSGIDTMIIETMGINKKYPVSDIAQITFSGTSTMNEDELSKINSILNAFTLNQNYPNPFNPTTNISYMLPERGIAQVRVYDINGRLVKEILSATQAAGEHKVTWDSKNNEGYSVASGIYFYQVQFKNSVLTKKMIYLK